MPPGELETLLANLETCTIERKGLLWRLFKLYWKKLLFIALMLLLPGGLIVLFLCVTVWALNWEIGSFQLTNDQRQWIWDHRDVLTGQVAEVRAMNVNKSGAIRAGVFVRFHPSRSEAGLLMYSESLAGGDTKESKSTLFRLKSAAGWKGKV